MNKLVEGIGFNDNKYQVFVKGEITKYYKLWQSMLHRCTDKEWERHPTYAGTSCSENFKSYSFFYEWCQEQIGFDKRDDKGRAWHLDKDLLIKGNKLYSEDNCVFVPQRINSLLTKMKASRGKYPIGVRLSRCKSATRFDARCGNCSGESKHLGCYGTPEEAFQAYKTYKEAYIKEVANEYRAQLDPRAYNALMSYEVNIND